MKSFRSPEDAQRSPCVIPDEMKTSSSTAPPIRAGEVFDSLRGEILGLSDDPVVPILASTLFGQGTKRWEAALVSIRALISDE